MIKFDRACHNCVPILTNVTRQRSDSDGSYPLITCRHIRYDKVLPERNHITVRCTALQTALFGLIRIVFCICRDSDECSIDECRINNRTVSERFRQRFGCNLDSISRKEIMKNVSRSFLFHRTPS